MKLGRNLNDLAAEIERQTETKMDLVANTKDLTVIAKDRPHLVVENVGEFPIRDIALGQMAEKCGVPAVYMSKMRTEAPELLASNLNHWFKSGTDRRLIRNLDGENRAYLSDRFRRIDNYDVVNSVLPILAKYPGLSVRSCEVTERRLYVKATFTHLEREVKSSRVGDLVRGGLMFGNSEVGFGRLFVTPWAEFTVCTNGAVRDGGKGWAHLGKKIGADEAGEVRLLSDETIAAGDRFDLLAFRDHIEAALNPVEFGNWLDKVQSTTDRKISGDVPKAVEILGQKVGLNKTEQSSVLRHLIEGGDLSQYGLFNAVTRAAEDASDYDRATEMEGLGGKVVSLNRSDWSEISMAEAA